MIRIGKYESFPFQFVGDKFCSFQIQFHLRARVGRLRNNEPQ